MNETQEKIRAMMKEEAAAKQKEALEERRKQKSLKKEKKPTTIKQQERKLLLSLVFLPVFILLAVGLFYAASIYKKDIEEKYHQQIESNAVKKLEALKKQAQSTLIHKINNFNYILKDAEYIKNFNNPLWQGILKAELAALLGEQAVIEIISKDFDVDEIIDKPEMGYAVLSLLNELKKTDNTQSARHMKIEVHRANSKKARLVFVRKVTYFDVDLDKEVSTGYIAASLSPVFLKELIKDFQSQSGYLELVQQFSGKSSILIKKGDSSLKGLPLLITKKVKNTQWTFNFWPKAQNNEVPLSLFKLPLIFVALGTIALILAILSLSLVFKNISSSILPAFISGKSKTKVASQSSSRKSSDDIENTDLIFKKTDGIAVNNEKAVPSEGLSDTADKIFRAYDIRGVVGDFINAPIFRQIAFAIAAEMTELQQNKIAIACDGRTSSPELVKALIEGLLHSGIHVIDIGMVTSPVLYFAAHTKTEGNGIVVTASHNPANYNGMKIMLAGNSYSGERLQSLKQRLLGNERVTTENTGRLEQLNVMEDYLTKITGNIILARPMTIVIDTSNAIAGNFAATLFQQLGCTVTTLNAEVDGNFPVHDPDPSRPENMAELVQKVTELKADLGIAFDGDGDRIGLVSSGGDIIWPDRILMLLAKDILSRNKEATILYDVKSTAKLEPFISELGGKPLMCQSGHSCMKSKLQETGALLAGEMSGHIFIKERWFGFDDGLFVAARILEILSIDLRKSRQVFAELPDSLNTPEILIATENGQGIMARMSGKLDRFKNGKVITIDGIRVEYPDGWGIVRSSNTSDNLTLRFEADNEAALQRIADVFKEAILAVEPELEFPF